MNVQLVVDFDWYIIGYIVGWPGCAQDVTSFESSQWFLNPTLFFSPGESILADKGYVVRLMLTVPYDDPELELDSIMDSQLQLRVQFNDGIKRKRIIIERVNARLKNRMAYLKGMRLQARIANGGGECHEDFKTINDVTVSCFVLYNFLIRHNDAWEASDDVQPVSDQFIDRQHELQAKQAKILARASACAAFSQREHELAARELTVQHHATFCSNRQAPAPFRVYQM
jgi:hypothetical protein